MPSVRPRNGSYTIGRQLLGRVPLYRLLAGDQMSSWEHALSTATSNLGVNNRPHCHISPLLQLLCSASIGVVQGVVNRGYNDPSRCLPTS
jgi:hypothetical protein